MIRALLRAVPCLPRVVAPVAPAEMMSTGALPVIPGFEAALPVASLPKTGLTKYVLRKAGVPVVVVTRGGVVEGVLLGVCPHKHADMSLGDIEESERGTCIKCPRHRKKFNGGLNFSAKTGVSWLVQPVHEKYEESWALPVYATQVHGGVLFVSEEPVKGTIPHISPEDLAMLTACNGTVSAAAASSVATASAPPKPPSSSTAAPASAPEPVGSYWTPCTVSSIRPVTHDTSVYRLERAGPSGGATDAAACSPHSWHVMLRLGPGGSPASAAPTAGAAAAAAPPALVGTVSREYTPISPLSAWVGGGGGYMDLLIKHYPHGALTSRLLHAGIAADVAVSKPQPTLLIPQMCAAGGGEAAAAAAAALPCGGPRSQVLLVAGGTGIAPMLQLARWALQPPGGAAGEAAAQRPERVSLVYACRTAADVALADELTQLAREHPVRLTIVYALSQQPPAASASAPALSVLPNTRVCSGGRVNAATLLLAVGGASAVAVGGADSPSTAEGLPLLSRIVVCGPAGMFASVKRAAAEAGLLLRGSAGGGGPLLVELDA